MDYVNLFIWNNFFFLKLFLCKFLVIFFSSFRSTKMTEHLFECVFKLRLTRIIFRLKFFIQVFFFCIYYLKKKFFIWFFFFIYFFTFGFWIISCYTLRMCCFVRYRESDCVCILKKKKVTHQQRNRNVGCTYE